MDKERLIKTYEEKLEKVKALYAGDWRKEKYIKFAERELEAVKRGGEPELMKFYEAHREI